MNRLIQATESYRMAGLKVAVDNVEAEYRVRLEAVDDPNQVIESKTLTPDAIGEIAFQVDTGRMETRAWRAVLVKTPSPEAQAIMEATELAMNGEADPPQVSAEDAQAAGLPLETPLGVVRTRDPLEQVFSVAPSKALDHIRAFSQSKGWTDAEHDTFVQQLREMGLATWRDTVNREVSERRRMLAMLENLA